MNSTPTEIIDIFDSKNNLVGEATKDEAHKKGLWHRTVGFILVDKSKERIYFQDKNKPSKLKTDDFFVKFHGGHLMKGEKPEEGVRELEEELGLEISKDRLIPLGTYQISADFSSDYKLREFIYWYLVDVHEVEQKIEFIDQEVKSVISFNPIEALEITLGKRETAKALVFDENSATEIQITKSAFKNFTNDNLYTRIFLATKRYFEGEDTEYLFV